jgi:hypothetical protein
MLIAIIADIRLAITPLIRHYCHYYAIIIIAIIIIFAIDIDDDDAITPPLRHYFSCH